MSDFSDFVLLRHVLRTRSAFCDWSAKNLLLRLQACKAGCAIPLCDSERKAGRARSYACGMNRDQIKGVAKIVAGKVQEKAGSLFDNPEFVVKGVSRQVAGKYQKGRGDIKKKIKDFRRDHPH